MIIDSLNCSPEELCDFVISNYITMEDFKMWLEAHAISGSEDEMKEFYRLLSISKLPSCLVRETICQTK